MVFQDGWGLDGVSIFEGVRVRSFSLYAQLSADRLAKWSFGMRKRYVSHEPSLFFILITPALNRLFFKTVIRAVSVIDRKPVHSRFFSQIRARSFTTAYLKLWNEISRILADYVILLSLPFPKLFYAPSYFFDSADDKALQLQCRILDSNYI